MSSVYTSPVPVGCYNDSPVKQSGGALRTQTPLSPYSIGLKGMPSAGVRTSQFCRTCLSPLECTWLGGGAEHRLAEHATSGDNLTVDSDYKAEGRETRKLFRSRRAALDVSRSMRQAVWCSPWSRRQSDASAVEAPESKSAGCQRCGFVAVPIVRACVCARACEMQCQRHVGGCVCVCVWVGGCSGLPLHDDGDASETSYQRCSSLERNDSGEPEWQ